MFLTKKSTVMLQALSLSLYRIEIFGSRNEKIPQKLKAIKSLKNSQMEIEMREFSAELLATQKAFCRHVYFFYS